MKSLIEDLSMWKLKSHKNVGAPADRDRLSAEEFKSMIAHTAQCPSCQAAEEDFSSFLLQLPQEERSAANVALLRHIQNGGLQERFLERARAEGFKPSDAPEIGPDEERQRTFCPSLAFRWFVAATVLVMILAGISYHTVHQRGIARRGDSIPPHGDLSSPLQSVTSHGTQGGAAANAVDARLTEIQATLTAANGTISTLQDENAALERDLATTRSEKQTLQQRLAELANLNSRLAGENEGHAQALASMKAQLDEARARGTQLEAEIASERGEVSTLSDRLKMQMDLLNQDRQLLAAGRDFTDLMGARNLHMVDVYNADARRKKPKSFGRIFYTEGKSLIFYAYDLDERKLANANYAFEVWGERLGEPASVRNLGILYADDKAQKRWTLKVSDPQQLAEINSVFVTFQHQDGKNPLGQKILFAYLGGTANHP
jgi:hypothetical protein